MLSANVQNLSPFLKRKIRDRKEVWLQKADFLYSNKARGGTTIASYFLPYVCEGSGVRGGNSASQPGGSII